MTAEDVVYKTPNPFSDDNRDVYFMSDVPHLIKTVRNCWSNSFAHSNSRALWVSGHTMHITTRWLWHATCVCANRIMAIT